MVEKTIKPIGFAVRSWGDVLAVVSLLSLLLGFLAWGLKLEGELNTLRNETRQELNGVRANITEIKTQVGRGVLPRAEERIEDHDRRLDKLEEQ